MRAFTARDSLSIRADPYTVLVFFNNYAPVICVSGPLGAGDTLDIAGLKCGDLTADESQQCRRGAGVLISR